MLGNVSNADSALQNSPYGTVPADFSVDLPSVQLGYMNTDGFAFNGPSITFDEQAFINILHKEYSVEISTLTTIGTHLFFMRRHGLLQELSITELPVPYSTLEAYQLANYTSGGLINYDAGRSAKRGSNWHVTESFPIPFNFEAKVSNKKAALSWAYSRLYPDQPTGFRLIGEGVDTTLSAQTTTYLADSLNNNVSYNYKLSVIIENREGNGVSLSFIPNVFSTNNKIIFDDGIVTDSKSTVSRWLYNETDSPTEIIAVKKNNFNADTTINDNWLDFINVDVENVTIAPGDSLLLNVSLESEYHGRFPAVEFEFSTNKDDFFLNTDRVNIRESSFCIEVLSWVCAHDLPDTIAFGSLEAGLVDSTEIDVKNKSLYGGSVDTVFTNKLIGGADSFIPDSVFTISGFDGSMWIPSGASFKLNIKASPTSNEPYEALIRRTGTMFGGSELGILTVNKGAEVITSNEDENDVPEDIRLFQNYPNPFNPSTTITYSIPKLSEVSLTVYNMLGQKVSTLVNKRMSAGKHTVAFDASNLASGMYFYRLQTPGKVLVEKMLLIK